MIATPTMPLLSSTNKSMGSSSRANPLDHRHEHVWFFEETNDFDNTTSAEVLTKSGIIQITTKWKYIAGNYTILDNILNPLWTYITYNFIPITIAPNTITALGGCCCLFSYIITAHYNFNLVNNGNNNTGPLPSSSSLLMTTSDNDIMFMDNQDGSSNNNDHDSSSSSVLPNWIYLVNGLCLMLYYTLDCCDGKS